jgi:hypothetical protein
MKSCRFNIGDMIKSSKIHTTVVDHGIVLDVGPRPDDGEEKLGVYARWANEGFAFWMDMDEPQLTLYVESDKGGRKHEC